MLALWSTERNNTSLSLVSLAVSLATYLFHKEKQHLFIIYISNITESCFLATRAGDPEMSHNKDGLVNHSAAISRELTEETKAF